MPHWYWCQEKVSLVQGVRVGNHHIYICSNGQAALKALKSEKRASRLAWSCLQELLEVSGKNWVNLMWVPWSREY